MIDIPTMWWLVVSAVVGFVVALFGVIMASGNADVAKISIIWKIFILICIPVGIIVCVGSIVAMFVADSACCNTCC